MQTIQQIMAGLRPIEMNADSEYARSFGIEKGDIVFLDRFINAVHGIDLNSPSPLPLSGWTFTLIQFDFA